MRRNYSRIIWGLTFVIVGLLMLLDRLNIVYFDLGEFIHQWWPLVLIIIGAGMVFDDKSGRHRTDREETEQ